MSTPTFSIFLGGNITVTDRLRARDERQPRVRERMRIRHAMRWVLRPRSGSVDFDSSDDALKPPIENRKAGLPASKAATDGEIAIAEAISRGAERMILVGALGGERSDHVLQHYSRRSALRKDNFEVMLTPARKKPFRVQRCGMELDLPRDRFSLFSVLRTRGSDIRNARYPLKNFKLTFGSSRTISNVAEGVISVNAFQGSRHAARPPF